MADPRAADVGPSAELRRALTGARFHLRLRGYDPVEVDDLLDHLAAIAAPVPPSPPGGPTMSTDPFPMSADLPEPAPIPSRPSFADRSFRTVLRGWDPKEVRAYLEELDRLYGQAATTESQDGERRSRELVAAARAEADLIVGAARREVDSLEAERDLLAGLGAGPTGLGEDLALAQVDAEQIRRAAREEADRIVAEAEERAAAQRAAVGPTPNRWEEAGVHVARVLEQADREAAAIRAAAETDARVQLEEAEVLRSEAAADRRDAAAEADRLLVEARAEADAVREAAVPRAREHIGEVLALAHDELEATRDHLARTVGDLRAVQAGLDRSLAGVGDLPELSSVDDLVGPLPILDVPDVAIDLPAGDGADVPTG